MIEWWPNGVMPMEIPESEPIVDAMLEATADLGLRRELGGLDSWYDGATFTQLAGIPSIGYGPPGFDPDGATVAHTIDEYVPVDGLVVVRAGAGGGGDAVLRGGLSAGGCRCCCCPRRVWAGYRRTSTAGLRRRTGGCSERSRRGLWAILARP